MPKTVINDEQLEKIIRLKQKNYSWLRMQKEFNIPRRSAKNAYKKWEKNRTIEELKGARMEVATQEFIKHLSDLVAIAEIFADHLPNSILLTQTRDADTVIHDIFGSNSTETDEKKKQRNIRRDELLFESLREHTREKLSWDILDDWKDQWNAGIKIVSEIKKNIGETLTNILNRKENESVRRLSKSDIKQKLYMNMINGIFEAVWRGILNGKPSEGFNQIWTKYESDKKALVLFGNPGSITILHSDLDYADKISEICLQAAQIIGKQDMAENATRILRQIRANADKLDPMFDAVKLKPIIIRTRCGLCPA